MGGPSSVDRLTTGERTGRVNSDTKKFLFLNYNRVSCSSLSGVSCLLCLREPDPLDEGLSPIRQNTGSPLSFYSHKCITTSSSFRVCKSRERERERERNSRSKSSAGRGSRVSRRVGSV